MSRRTTGTFLIVTSAILYVSRHLAAAIYSSSSVGWSRDLFNAMLQYVGQGLVTWSVIALACGIGYLIWAEIEEALKAK